MPEVNTSNNAAVIAAVDAKRTSLDTAIARLDELAAKRSALAESVGDLKKQEAEHLRDEAANEDEAVRRLVEVRARVDVQVAGLNSLDGQIKEQRAQVISIGNSAWGSRP
ncbi:MAG TPA: hypothetical protein VE242_08300 [Chthoniobacterales bacterium]|nr:hypothetical protein [Chthoniobacterales bacterium]